MKVFPSSFIATACVTAGGLYFARWYGAGRLVPARLQGQVAIVTGGSRGLGLLLARELARLGARVILCARDGEELERAAQWLLRQTDREDDAILVRVADVSRRNEVRELVRYALEVFGRLDVFVNDAGIIQVGPLEAQSTRDFDEAMAVNFWGLFHGSMEAFEIMKRQGFGRILNITSIGGSVPVPHLLPYSASKFAAQGFSEGLGAEARRHGVSVTTIIPGLMRTGSHLRALFKGRRRRELAWFSWGASLPLLSMDAERAARAMIRACLRGRRVAVVGLPAKLLRTGFQLMPNLALRVFSLVSRALPDASPEAASKEAKPGLGFVTPLSSNPLTRLGDRAADRFNERKVG